MCIFKHDWFDYTDPVDTGNHIFMAQFKSCKRCNKVKVEYIKMKSGDSICEVKADKANHALTKS